MAVTVTHATVATGADAGNGEIRKSHWNANHVVANAADVTAANTFQATQQISTGAAKAAMQLNANSGQSRRLECLTGGSLRWDLGAENTGESSGNVGSHFSIIRYDDSGGFLSVPLAINRTTGKTTLEALNVTGALQTGNKYVPYIFAQSGAAQSVGAVTTEATLATVSFAGGELGPNGFLVINSQWSTNNNANNKTLNIRMGGVAGTLYHNTSQSTSLGQMKTVYIMNQNSVSAQKSVIPAGNQAGTGSVSSAAVTSAVNTAAAWDLVFSGTKAVAGDTLTLEGYQVLVCYGA